MKSLRLAIILLSSLLLAGCGKSTTPATTAEGIKKETGQIEKQMQGGGIVVPANLLKCEGDYKDTICPNKEPEEEMCDYYQKTYPDGRVIIDNVGRTRLCSYCKMWQKYKVGDAQVVSLGYEKKPCYQGMYAKQ